MKAAAWTTAMIAVVTAGCAGLADARVTPQTVAGPHVRGAEWFRQTGCTACHSISAYNTQTVAAQGPDLSTAVADVPNRFGVSLDDFMHRPSGTMAMVLSSRILLTPEQRDLAIARLKEVYRVHQQQTGAVSTVASH